MYLIPARLHHQLDLMMIAGSALDDGIDPRDEYLLQYFYGRLTVPFARFYSRYRELLKYVDIKWFVKYFVDCSGRQCTFHGLARVLHQLILIEEIMEEARRNLDLETVAAIQKGEYRFSKHKQWNTALLQRSVQHTTARYRSLDK